MSSGESTQSSTILRPGFGEIMSRVAIEEWITSLSRMLWDFRREKHDDDWWTKITDRLEKERYTYSRAHLAELWIIKGNRYGRRETALADFFPSKEQAESADIDVVPTSVVSRIINETRQRTRQEVQSEMHNAQVSSMTREERAEMISQARMKCTIIELNNEIDDLKRELRMAHECLKVRQHKIDSLKGLNREYLNLLQQRKMTYEEEPDNARNETDAPAGNQGSQDEVDSARG